MLDRRAEAALPDAGREVGRPREAAAGPTLPESPGPHAVGILQSSFTHATHGSYKVTVYYPSSGGGPDAPPDASRAPYPMVVFAHGYLGNKDANTWVGRHLASRGYVCLYFSVPDPSVAPMDPWVDGIIAGLDHLVFLGAKPLLAGLLGTGAAVAGHSKGANASLLAALKDARVKAVVALTPCLADYEKDSGITAAVQLQSGALDGICEPSQAVAHYAALKPSKQLVEIAGANHIGFLDAGLVYDAARALVKQGTLSDKKATITRDEQERISRRYLTAWLDRTLKGDTAADHFLFGAEAQKDKAQGRLSQLLFELP